jgi:hypothetical protein
MAQLEPAAARDFDFGQRPLWVNEPRAISVSGFCRFSLFPVSCLHSNTVAFGRCVPTAEILAITKKCLPSSAADMTPHGHDTILAVVALSAQTASLLIE